MEARGARAELEAALDVAGWKYSVLISRWMDALLLMIEARGR
jgi:hypothetical protein